jgi:hypothetical protein
MTMRKFEIDDRPASLPVLAVLGAMTGAATENLMTGVGSAFEDVLTGAFVGAILAMTLIMWLRSE